MDNPFIAPKESNPFIPTVVETNIGEWSTNLSKRLGGILNHGSSLAGMVHYAHWERQQIDNDIITGAQNDYHEVLKEALPVMVEEGEDIQEAAQDAPQTVNEAMEISPVMKSLLGYQKYLFILGKEMDDASWTDYAWTLLPDLSIDAAQMTRGDDLGAQVSEYFSGNRDLDKWHQAYLASDDPVAFVEAVYEVAKSVSDDNPLRVVELLQNVIEGPETWMLELDKVGLAALPFDLLGVKQLLAKTGKAVVNGTSGIRLAKNSVEEAGVIRAASTEEGMDAAVGIPSDVVNLGIMDQEGLMATGLPPRNVHKLEEFNRMVDDYTEELASMTRELDLPDPELAANRLRAEDVHAGASHLLGADAAFRKHNNSLLMDPRYFAENQAARLVEDYVKPLVDSLTRDVKKSGFKDQFEDLMLQLDEAQEWWSKDRFAEHFSHSWGASDKQVELLVRAAAKQRKLGDVHWLQMNKLDVERRTALGYTKDVLVGGKNINVKPFESVQSAVQSMRHKKVDRAFDVTTGERVILKSGEQMGKYLGDTKTIVKTNRKSDLVDDAIGDSAWDYLIVSKADVREASKLPIAYRTGYYPKFNKNVRFLAKVPVAGKINGVATDAAYWKVDQAFSTSQAAAKYKAANPHVDIRPAREWTDGDMLQAFDMHGGGMYTGGRKKTPLLVDGVPAIREKTADEAFAKAYGYLVRKNLLMRTTENAEKIWMKSAEPFLDEVAKRGPFEAAVGRLNSGDKAMDARMAQLHNYIVRMKTGNGGKVTSTNQWVINRAGEYRGTNEKISKTLWWLAEADPIQGLKTAAYNAFMGLSPIQLLIQSSALVPTFAKAPRAFTKAMPDILEALNVDMFPQAYKLLKGERKHAYDLWHKSGLRASVSSIPDFAHVSKAERLQKLTNWMTEQGEATQRLGAFMTAYHNLPKAARTLRKVTTEQRRLGVDMSSANKAGWQDGFTGLLFQFHQITARGWSEFAPVVMGGKDTVTRGERARVWAATLAGLGVVGLPFGDVLDRFVPQFFPPDSDATLLEGYKRGLTGILLNEMGLDNEINTRINLAPTLPMLVTKIMDGQASWMEFFGPSGTLLDRGVQAMRTAKEAIIKHQDPANVIMGFLSIPSGTRHLMKEYIYAQTGKMYGRNGQVLPQVNLNMGEQILLALGLPPTEIQDYYDQAAIEKSREEYKQYVMNILHRDLLLGFTATDELQGMFQTLAIADPDLFGEAWTETIRRYQLKPDARSVMIEKLLEGKFAGTPTEARLLEELTSKKEQ